MTRPQKQPISKSNRVWEIERQKLSLCRNHEHKYNHSPVSLACTVWLPHTPSPITSMVYSYTRKFGSIPEVITDRHIVWLNWLTQLIVGFRNNSPSSGTHRLLYNCPLAPAGQDTWQVTTVFPFTPSLRLKQINSTESDGDNRSVSRQQTPDKSPLLQ